MRARDLAEQFPIVRTDSEALQAARDMADQSAPGIIVCNDAGVPYTVLPGSQVLNFIIPRYIQDQPGLARAFDEQASDDLCRKLYQHSVRDLLPRPADVDDLPAVDADATTIEIAAVMAKLHSPLVAVVHDGRVLGAVTVSRLLTHLLPA